MIQFSEWDLAKRNQIVTILEDLIKKHPENIAYAMLLDGFYSQQMLIENLSYTIATIKAQSKLEAKTEKQVDKTITDVTGIFGNLEDIGNGGPG